MLQEAHSALRLRLVSSSGPTPTFYLISRMPPVNMKTNLGGTRPESETPESRPCFPPGLGLLGGSAGRPRTVQRAGRPHGGRTGCERGLCGPSSCLGSAWYGPAARQPLWAVLGRAAWGRSNEPRRTHVQHTAAGYGHLCFDLNILARRGGGCPRPSGVFTSATFAADGPR